MATSTVAAVAKMAHFVTALAFLLPTAVAGPATITAMADLPDYFQSCMMTLSLDPAEAGPVPFEYSVVPLTRPAGLNVTNLNILNAINVEGPMVSVDQTNFNLVNDSSIVVYMSCDSNDATSNISPSDVLNGLMAMVNKPKAILLYTVTGTYCSLEGNGLAYNSTWSMISSDDAYSALNVSRASTGTIVATLTANGTSDVTSDDDGGGNNSAVAMSILYSITGLITLLFLIIIATGAVRAHRHPERYGPRAGLGGRPRQSRARGIARAVLETLPIVKFGDPHPVKGDPENELESLSGDRRLDSPVPALPKSTNEAVAQQGNPPTRDGLMTAAGAEHDARSTKSDERVDDEHLGCTICTEDFTVGEDVRVLPCNHKFHPPCIDPWLVNVSGTCPLCRLDLRPAGSREDEAPEFPDQQTILSLSAPDQEVPEELNDPDVAQNRRVSRLLDWNRLRHASVDERIQALRQIREQQDGSAPVGDSPTEDGNHHARLTDRLREKFHIRTRTQS